MPPPTPRTCCILSPTLGLVSNILDPSALGQHGTSSEGNGIMYFTQFGFIDFGHVRDCADLTKWVHDELGRSLATILTTHGEASLLASMSGSLRSNVAQAIAYQDSVGYEIHTFDSMHPGGHNSSFSPEDLVSNYLGTWVAAEAIRRSENPPHLPFAREVDNVLGWVVRTYGGQSQAGTDAAFSYITSRGWISGSIFNNDFLRRRNFTRTPWLVPHVRFGSPTTATLPDVMLSTAAHYSFTYKATSPSISATDYPAKITAIQTRSRAAYGIDHNRP